jgi:hypothetical protein
MSTSQATSLLPTSLSISKATECFSDRNKTSDGNYEWPPNWGCVSDPLNVKRVTLEVGKLIDRFGRETGEFFSPVSESYKKRSLSGVKDTDDCKQFYSEKYNPTNNSADWQTANDYNVYKVIKEFVAVQCEAAPHFGLPGGATQYWVPKNLDDPMNTLKLENANKTIKELVETGYIEKQTKTAPPSYDGGNRRRSRRSKRGRKHKATKRRKDKKRVATRRYRR